MILAKTSEKLVIWMLRRGYSQQELAQLMGITRQSLAGKIKDNIFSVKDIIILKGLGFDNN